MEKLIQSSFIDTDGFMDKAEEQLKDEKKYIYIYIFTRAQRGWPLGLAHNKMEPQGAAIW